MPSRRTFLQLLSSLPLLNRTSRSALAAPLKRDYLKELGVRPIINGAGVYTMMTGSLMNPEAVRAIEAMSHHFVRLDELHDAVGQRIASLLGCEAAMVPSGAAAGLTLATAACMTGTNPEFILRLPDTTGMKNEVLIQKAHRFPYDHAVRCCGVRLTEVTTAEELERAITPRTAMLLFLNKSDPLGQIKAAEFVQIGKKHGIPTLKRRGCRCSTGAESLQVHQDWIRSGGVFRRKRIAGASERRSAVGPQRTDSLCTSEHRTE